MNVVEAGSSSDSGFGRSTTVMVGAAEIYAWLLTSVPSQVSV